jgi:uncharacterized protein (UPF0305 family)
MICQWIFRNSKRELLKEQEVKGEVVEGFDPAFFRIYQIISIYTTFIVEEPLHPVGTPFPGGFKVNMRMTPIFVV